MPRLIRGRDPVLRRDRLHAGRAKATLGWSVPNKGASVPRLIRGQDPSARNRVNGGGDGWAFSSRSSHLPLDAAMIALLAVTKSPLDPEITIH